MSEMEQVGVEKLDIDDLGLGLFIDIREQVAKEWGHKEGSRVSKTFLDGVDAEANKRIREELVKLRLSSAPAEQSKPILEGSWYSKAVDFSHRLINAEGDDYADALNELAQLMHAAAMVPVIQQNANDNYAASESRLHEKEAESWILRRELAKDDDLMADMAMKLVAQSKPSLEDVADLLATCIRRHVSDAKASPIAPNPQDLEALSKYRQLKEPQQ